MSRDDQPPVRIGLPLVLASIAGLWLCYFVLATARSWFLGSEDGWELFWRRGVVSAAGMGLTLILWAALRCFDRSTTFFRIMAALFLSLPLSMLSAQVNYSVFRDLDKALSHEKETVVVKIRRDRDDGLLRDLPLPPLSPMPPAAPQTGAPPLPPPIPAPPEVAAGATRVVIGEAPDKPRPVMLAVPGLFEIELASWDYLTDMTFGRYFMLLAWCALYLALVEATRARLAERREGEFRRAASQAELRSLRYQVNPHFLFNTLNSLSALVMTGRPERAEDMIQALSTYYRRTLSGDPTGDVTLADEVALQQLYLDIEAVRFPERLRTQVEISPVAAAALVPGMILQPIIENSVKYAIAARREPVTIGISGREEGGRLVLSVRDDGPMTGTGDPHGEGIGLANVRDRLQARFGDAASLTFGPRADGGFETVLTMPLERRGG
jgi:two-component system LytT family sensor kinase